MAYQPSALLDPTRLGSLLTRGAGRFDVDALDCCDSTSSELSRRAQAGAPAGTVVVADAQTAGRGRRGRAWLAGPEEGLTFSLLWRFPRDFRHFSGLSLAVGVAVARACARLGADGVGLKWPNDVLAAVPGGWGKLAGILVELQAQGDGMLAVIGIGLNLQTPRLPPGAGLPVASLAERLGAVPERHAVMAALLDALAEVLEVFSRQGFAACREEWQGYHVWQDQPVVLMQDGQLQGRGRCLGADEDGALLLEREGKVVRYLAGDLSLRPA